MILKPIEIIKQYKYVTKKDAHVLRQYLMKPTKMKKKVK